MSTDSTTVLQWTRKNYKKQQVFVAIKVAEILDSTTADQWNSTNGVRNPTDLGARGVSCSELTESDWLLGLLWRKGEDWFPHSVKKTTNENQQKDDHVKVATNSEAHIYYGAFVSNPIDWEQFSQ